MKKSDAERIEELEFVVAYLQKQLGDLDAVVQSLNASLLKLTREIHRLRNDNESVKQQLDGGGNLPHERPPHY